MNIYDYAIISLLFFIVIIIALYFNSRKTTFKVDVSVNTKEEYFDEIKAIKSELLLKPFNGGLYFYLGNYYYKLELYNKALFCYSIFEKLRGNDHYICFNKALAYKQKGDNRRAYKYFLLTLEHDSHHIYALLELGNIEFQNNNYSKSKEYFLKAYSINSCNPDTLFSLGVLCGQIKEFNESIDYLSRATAIESNPSAYYFLGLSYFDLYDFENSIVAFTNAIELKDDYGLAYLKRSIAKLSISDMSAIEDLERAEELIPHNPELILTKTNYNKLNIDYTSSIDIYNEILNSNPYDIDALNGKGLLLGIDGDFKEAIACFDKALSKDEKNENSLHLKASAEKELGNHKDALDVFLSLIKYHPDNLDVNLGIAECYFALNDIDMAINHFNKHIEINGRNMGDCYYGLAMCYEEMNNPVLAKENFFLSGTHGNITSILMMAKLALADKRFDDALIYYNQAKTLQPDFKELDEMIKLTIIQAENEKLKNSLEIKENDKGEKID